MFQADEKKKKKKGFENNKDTTDNAVQQIAARW